MTNVTTSLNCSHLLEDTNVLDIKEKTGVGTVQLVVHRQSKHGALKHSCDQCEPWFPFPGILMNHKESSHEASKYSCSDCDHEAIRMEHLGRQFKRFHENRSPSQECDSISV